MTASLSSTLQELQPYTASPRSRSRLTSKTIRPSKIWLVNAVQHGQANIATTKEYCASVNKLAAVLVITYCQSIDDNKSEYATCTFRSHGVNVPCKPRNKPSFLPALGQLPRRASRNCAEKFPFFFLRHRLSNMCFRQKRPS